MDDKKTRLPSNEQKGGQFHPTSSNLHYNLYTPPVTPKNKPNYCSSLRTMLFLNYFFLRSIQYSSSCSLSSSCVKNDEHSQSGRRRRRVEVEWKKNKWGSVKGRWKWVRTDKFDKKKKKPIELPLLFPLSSGIRPFSIFLARQSKKK